MKQQINEIKRMQQLAGLINEGQLNEDEPRTKMGLYLAFGAKDGKLVFTMETPNHSENEAVQKAIEANGVYKLRYTDDPSNYLKFKGDGFKKYVGKTAKELGILNESQLNETKLFADFSVESESDTSLKSRFARSISEIAREYDHLDNIEIPRFFDEYEDGDDFYAGPTEALRFFQTLPEEFVVTNNLNDVEESFKITKTGDDSFTAEEI